MPQDWSHQKTALDRFGDTKSFALFWEMGSGKTKVAIDIVRHRLAQGQINKALIFTPSMVIPHWIREFKRFAPELTVLPIVGSRAAKINSMCTLANVYITNYETLTFLAKELNIFVLGTTFIVFDESTRVKHHESKRSKTAREISLITQHKCILTGTPVTNSLFDIWNQMFLLDGGFRLGKNFWIFRQGLFHAVDRNKYIWVPNDGTEDKIRKAMSNIGSVLKKEDCLDLPPKVYRKIDVPMNDYTKGLYEEFAQNLILQFGDSKVEGQTVLTEMIKAHEIVNGFVIASNNEAIPIASAKIEALIELLSEELYGEQVVIWCSYRHLIERLFQEIRKAMPNVAVRTLYGETPRDERLVLEDDWKAKKFHILVANQDVGGYGINLTPCNVAIYFCNNFKVETRVQSEDRIHRPGATADKVTIIDMVVPNSADQTVYSSLMRKTSIASSMMTVKDMFTPGEQDETP